MTQLTWAPGFDQSRPASRVPASFLCKVDEAPIDRTTRFAPMRTRASSLFRTDERCRAKRESRRAGTRSLKKAAARKLRFAEQIQSDLGRPVVYAKIYFFPLAPNQWLLRRCPASTRGAYRDRHERGAGCGGRGSVRRGGSSQGELNLMSDERCARRRR